MVLLVKPQFEAGREGVGRGGVVRDPAVWRAAVEGVARALQEHGIRPLGVAVSPLTGPAGNVEFLLHGRRGGVAAEPPSLDLEAAIAEAEGLRGRGRRRQAGPEREGP